MVLEAQFLGEAGAKEDPPYVGAACCSQTEQGGSGRVLWGSLQQDGPFHITATTKVTWPLVYFRKTRWLS